MSMIYCHRGDHQVDTDFNCEGMMVGKDKDEWCCWDHLNEEELVELEKAENEEQEATS